MTKVSIIISNISNWVFLHNFYFFFINKRAIDEVRSDLFPKIWARIDEDIKQSFGLKYAHFAANNNQDEKKLAKQFLQIVNGERYIPDQLRAVEIDNTIHKVLSAHRGFNNFYSEPPFARERVRILGEPMKIPKIIERS